MQPMVTGWRRYTLVEPPLMLFFFCYSVTGAVLTDFMLYRSCQKIMGQARDECEILHTNSSSEDARNLEKEIQPHASYILMCKSFVDGVTPALLSLFMGPWSDKYGRKPLMIVGYAGTALGFLLWTILCNFQMNPWIYLVASIPPALAGGFCGVILASMCYITDMGNNSNRTWHFAWMQAAIAAGMFIGSFVGRLVFEYMGYSAVFAIASACSAIAMLYVLFLVPETIVRTNVRDSWCSLFDVTLVKDMFVTCTKKRDGFNRTIVWSCITGLAINILIVEGESGIAYMFAAVRLGWDVNDFMTFQATTVFVSIVGTLLGAKIVKILIDNTMKDMLIVVIANASSFAGVMTKALTTKTWHFYLSPFVGMIGPLTSPVLRSALSFAAPPEDTGKIFSFTTSMESIIPLAAPFLYTLIYTYNLPPVYPSPVYLASGGFYLVIMILAVIVDMQIRKPIVSPYAFIEEEINIVEEIG